MTSTTDTTQYDYDETTDGPIVTPEKVDAPNTDPPAEQTDHDEDRPGREAAKYRRQLRETEAERDTLRGRLESFQRTEVERIAGATITHPAGLWAAGVELSGLLTDEGMVDPGKVGEATRQAADALGLTRRPPPGYVAREGSNPGPGRSRAGMLDALMGTDPVN